MHGFHGNIEQLTLENTNFRKVLYTAKHSQLVLMTLEPGQDIGSEIHTENDQFLRFESGTGTAVIDDSSYAVVPGSVIIVPAGAQHNVTNTSQTEQLKLYTLYSPAHHKDGIVQQTKEEAEASEEEFDGTTTE